MKCLIKTRSLINTGPTSENSLPVIATLQATIADAGIQFPVIIIGKSAWRPQAPKRATSELFRLQESNFLRRLMGSSCI